MARKSPCSPVGLGLQPYSVSFSHHSSSSQVTVFFSHSIPAPASSSTLPNAVYIAKEKTRLFVQIIIAIYIFTFISMTNTHTCIHFLLSLAEVTKSHKCQLTWNDGEPSDKVPHWIAEQERTEINLAFRFHLFNSWAHKWHFVDHTTSHAWHHFAWYKYEWWLYMGDSPPLPTIYLLFGCLDPLNLISYYRKK